MIDLKLFCHLSLEEAKIAVILFGNNITIWKGYYKSIKSALKIVLEVSGVVKKSNKSIK